MIDPEKDGIDHINVYSKGKTSLGRFLSNFALCPIETEDGPFDSIEGYWYWLGYPDDRLRTVFGFRAKQLGRELGASDWQDGDVFKRKICDAITAKMQTSDFYEILDHSVQVEGLPLKHYYNYSGKVVEPEEGKWIIEHISGLLY